MAMAFLPLARSTKVVGEDIHTHVLLYQIRAYTKSLTPARLHHIPSTSLKISATRKYTKTRGFEQKKKESAHKAFGRRSVRSDLSMLDWRALDCKMPDLFGTRSSRSPTALCTAADYDE